MSQRCVVTLARDPDADPHGHDYLSRAALAHKLARVLGHDFAGEYAPARDYGAPPYFVPQDTLLAGQARALGIASEADLFGGVVPERFVATKAITHVALDCAAALPPRWSHALADTLRGVVLPGYSAFAPADVARAARRLLAHGRVRIKPAHALGGAGQEIVADEAAIEAAVAALDAQQTAEHGVAVEINIEAPCTLSVGELHAGGCVLAYHGTQRTVTNHAGRQVYGGSDLEFVRGAMAALRAQVADAALGLALEQARAYDAAVDAAFAEFFASRRNYDVLQGADARGEFVSGVLEQSWRLGGASPAEIVALEAFRRDPGLERLHVRSVETYAAHALPPGAIVHYDGVDARAGRLRKYVLLGDDAGAAPA